ncbi:MAG: hypothetical protein LAT81_16555, partial [Oceanicaulis sp.]|nr:hypothetical protein [Oceanicaulis sp.]
MKLKIKTYMVYVSVAMISFSFSNCMAWPGLTALFGVLGNAKSPSPIFILPPGSSSQPQDNPRPSDNTDLILDPDSFEIPVTPNPGSPEVMVVSRTGNVVSESGSSTTVSLSLSQGPSQNVRIHNFNLSMAGEVSVSPAEFIFTPENWDSPQILTITGVPDSIQDGDKELTIQLGSMESVDSRFQGVDAGEIYVLNTDIDSAGIALYPLTGLQTSEDGDTDQLSAVLNSRPTAEVTFTVQVSPPSEVSASLSSITFTPDNWNNPQVITITGLNDSIKDGNQPFTVQLVSGSSSDSLYNGLNSSIAHGINLDNDTASIVVNTTAPLPYTTSEDGTSITFRVRLSSEPTHPVTIPVYSLNPLEGQPNTANLVFNSGNWNVEQNLVVTGQNDNDIDGDKLYTIRLDKPVSDDAEYSELHQIDISLTNLDNDFAALVFSNHLNLTTGEDGTNDNFRIRLRSRPTADVTIHLESSDLTEGTINPTSVTFTPSNWNTNRTVNINGVNDSLIDGDIWYEIRFTSIVSADSEYNGLVVDPLPVINMDDDTPGVMYLGASGITTTESQTGTTSFQVRLKTRPTDNVRFPLITSNNTNEGTITTSELLFTPSNWNVPQTITIQPVRDWIVDPDVLYQIVFGNLESDDPLYSDFAVDSVPVTNRNSDSFGYIFSPAFGSFNPVVTDTGLKDSFTLRLNSKPTANVTIPLSPLDPSRLAVSTSDIEFTPDNWDTPVSVELEGVFVLESTPINTTIGLRMGAWNSGEAKYYPTGSSDYASFAFVDRNGTTSDNGILNVRRFNTQRPITVVHPLIANASSRLTTTEAGVEVPLLIRLGWEPTST